MDHPTSPSRRIFRPSPLADVQVELTEAMFHKLLGTIIVGSLSVLWLTVMIARTYNDAWMWTYVRWVFVVSGSRIGIVLAFKLRPRRPLTVVAARRWQYVYEAHTVSTCAFISLSSLHNFRVHDLVAANACVFGTFSTLAAMSGRVGVRPWVLRLSAIAGFSTIAYSMATSANFLLRVSTLLVVGFMLALFHSVRTQFDMWLEQVRGRHKLRELAERDTLTGLANRHHFHQTLETRCREQVPFAILYIDLDKFKAVNDTLGHAAGDTLLRRVAERLQATIRPTDLLARLGGDEFAVLLFPLPDIAAAETLAQRINVAIAIPFDLDGHPTCIGASIGIESVLRGSTTPGQLLQTADKALYRVKKAGGGSFAFGPA